MNNWTGRHHSIETRKKISLSMQGNSVWNAGQTYGPNDFRDEGNHIILIIRRRDNYPEEHHDVEVMLDRDVFNFIRKDRWWTCGKIGYNDYAWRRDFGKMHRYILGLKKGDKRRVVHINHNRFDNRLSNLMIIKR